jgi:hypothetical protein
MLVTDRREIMKEEKIKYLKLLSEAVKGVTGVEYDPTTFLGQLQLRRYARKLSASPEAKEVQDILLHMDAHDPENEPPLDITPDIGLTVRTDIHIPDHLNYFMRGRSYVQNPGPEFNN